MPRSRFPRVRYDSAGRMMVFNQDKCAYCYPAENHTLDNPNGPNQCWTESAG